MKIFLKILGFIFTMLLTGLALFGFWLMFFDGNMNKVIRLFTSPTFDEFLSILLSIGMAVFIIFFPIWYEINEGINYNL